jgi:hypothetical protein
VRVERKEGEGQGDAHEVACHYSYTKQNVKSVSLETDERLRTRRESKEKAKIEHRGWTAVRTSLSSPLSFFFSNSKRNATEPSCLAREDTRTYKLRKRRRWNIEERGWTAVSLSSAPSQTQSGTQQSRLVSREKTHGLTRLRWEMKALVVLERLPWPARDAGFQNNTHTSPVSQSELFVQPFSPVV